MTHPEMEYWSKLKCLINLFNWLAQLEMEYWRKLKKIMFYLFSLILKKIIIHNAIIRIIHMNKIVNSIIN